MNFQKRVIYLRSSQQVETLLKLLPNLPLDADKPLQVTIEEYRPGRKLSQQALLFAGPMTDISMQAWFDGRQYSVEVLHEFCKRQFLPEEFDPELCKDGFLKWDIDPLGNRILVGSTTMLTVKGYSRYLDQVHAFGGNLGVLFHERER